MTPADIIALREMVARLDEAEAEAEAAHDAAARALEDAEVDLAASVEELIAECRSPTEAMAAVAASRDAWAVQVLDGWAVTDGHALLWVRGVERPDVRRVGWLAGRAGPTAAGAAKFVTPYRSVVPLVTVARDALATACERDRDLASVTAADTWVDADLMRAFVLSTGADPVPVLAWPALTPQGPLVCGCSEWIACVMPLSSPSRVNREWPGEASR